MKRFSKYLPFALFAAFFFAALVAFLQSRPTPKNPRIYEAVKPCVPYYFQKRLGGLTIRSKTDPEFKLKPDSSELFHQFEALEKKWAKQAMKRHGDTLEVYDANGTVCARITLQNDDERRFVESYYGVTP